MRKSNERRSLSRVRRLALPLVLLSLSACVQTTRPATEPDVAKVDPSVASMYSAIDDGGNLVPAVDAAKIESKNVRQLVNYRTKEPPGTIVVDPYARFLYLVMENGKAMRYGVGVAKAGLEFVGEADIARKAQWPGWTPTQDMIKRDPERYEPLAKGLPGGLKNPLGARALYLYKGGQDTLYRIHGTNEPWSIGKSVSSGCIRMLNQDIIDLHRRVPKGSRVVVLGPEQSGTGEI
jgi:lipoprotein-anchoring transpeptidase ErfK/SrfK